MVTWREHVKSTYSKLKKTNKKIQFKDALKKAAKTWKKKK